MRLAQVSPTEHSFSPESSFNLRSILRSQSQKKQQVIEESVSAAAKEVTAPPASGVQSKIAHQSLKGSTSHLTQAQQAMRKKYNLTKWKYAELRDTINTSVGG